MRVLFLTEYYLYDQRTDVSGVFQRMRMLIDAVKTLGELDILFFTSPGMDTSPAASRQLESTLADHWDVRANVFFRHHETSPIKPFWTRLPFWARCIASGAVAYQSGLSLNSSHRPSVDAVNHCLDRQPDLVLAFRLGTMAPLLRTSRPLPPIFFDLDDAEHVKALRTARHDPGLRPRAAAYASVPILLWSERRAMSLACSTFVCSTRDRRRFRHFPRHQYRAIVPNAVAIPAAHSPCSELTLLYLGNYVYPPNVEAADFLVREIWPRVHARQPNARLLIAGSYAERIPGLAGQPAGVEVLGFVDDLSALYRRTRVVCCPIRVAGGTRVKILEAAAFGKPVVATTVGAEGLDLHNDRELLLRDDPQSFADACVSLLGDPGLAERLGTAARAAVSRLYDREATVVRIRRLITATLESQ